jgi:hypothetical protein
MKNTSTSKAAKGSNLNALKNTEVWYQDPEDGNLWHGTHGVIVNTAALLEREFFYNIERVAAPVKSNSRKRNTITVAYA